MIYDAGSINERGFINNLDRQGFTKVKCGSELIANSIDANSSNIIFTLDINFVKLMDDGYGMTLDKLKTMVNVYGEHHCKHKSMGVSGFGFSAASFQWSKGRGKIPKRVYVYTKNKNSNYFKACIPWDTMFNEGLFTGQIKITLMTSDEISDFILTRRNAGLREIGTTIVFPYAESIRELLDEQFDKEKSNSDNLGNSWRIIFGKTEQCIRYYDGVQ
jgi:hypothetical protein